MFDRTCPYFYMGADSDNYPAANKKAHEWSKGSDINAWTKDADSIRDDV